MFISVGFFCFLGDGDVFCNILIISAWNKLEQNQYRKNTELVALSELK